MNKKKNTCNALPTSTFPTSCANYPGGCKNCNKNDENQVTNEWGTYNKGTNNYKMNGCQ